jgi:hypothetical protein
MWGVGASGVYHSFDACIAMIRTQTRVDERVWHTGEGMEEKEHGDDSMSMGALSSMGRNLEGGALTLMKGELGFALLQLLRAALLDDFALVGVVAVDAPFVALVLTFWAFGEVVVVVVVDVVVDAACGVTAACLALSATVSASATGSGTRLLLRLGIPNVAREMRLRRTDWRLPVGCQVGSPSAPFAVPSPEESFGHGLSSMERGGARKAKGVVLQRGWEQRYQEGERERETRMERCKSMRRCPCKRREGWGLGESRCEMRAGNALWSGLAVPQ